MLLRKAWSPLHTHSRAQHVSFQEKLYRRQLPSCREQVKWRLSFLGVSKKKRQQCKGHSCSLLYSSMYLKLLNVKLLYRSFQNSTLPLTSALFSRDIFSISTNSSRKANSSSSRHCRRPQLPPGYKGWAKAEQCCVLVSQNASRTAVFPKCLACWSVYSIQQLYWNIWLTGKC